MKAKTTKKETPIHYLEKGCKKRDNKTSKTTRHLSEVTCEDCFVELEKKLILINVDHWESGALRPIKHRKPMSDIIKKLEQAFSIDTTVEEACIYAGISRETYYAWSKLYPDLSDRLKGLRKNPILKAKQTLASSLDDVKDAQWYAERKAKAEFSTRVENLNQDTEDLDDITEITDAIENWKPKK